MNRDDVRKDWEWRSTTPCAMLKISEDSAFEEEERFEILGLLPSFQGKRVLELAAGIGRFTGAFAKEASEVTTVEFMPNFVEESKRRNGAYANITYLCEDAMEVDFAESSFDLVFISWLFLQLEDEEMQQLTSRIERWLSPGGSFFLRESCSAVHKYPTEVNPTHYRTLKEYDDLLSGFTLKKEGSLQSWINHLAKPFSCYWLVEKTSILSISPEISGIPVRVSTNTPPTSK